MSELVSVIIPTYNREKTIERAILSVINQSYKNYEIIIVDDNSRDNTEEIVLNYVKKYDFINYIKHKENKGGSAARNTGVKVAKGNIISFLDSDDEWLKEKLELDIEAITKEQADMVYSDMISINVDTGEKQLCNRNFCDDIYFELLQRNIIGGTSLISVRKEVFENVGGFKEGLPSCQDWEFYLNIAEKYKIFKINKPLIKYYIHNNSISGNLENAIKGHTFMLSKVQTLIDNKSIYNNKQKSKIISEHYITIAMIYRRFKNFKELKKTYIKAWKANKFNKIAIKNIIISSLGEKIYYKLIRKK